MPLNLVAREADWINMHSTILGMSRASSDYTLIYDVLAAGVTYWQFRLTRSRKIPRRTTDAAWAPHQAIELTFETDVLRVVGFTRAEEESWIDGGLQTLLASMLDPEFYRTNVGNVLGRGDSIAEDPHIYVGPERIGESTVIKCGVEVSLNLRGG